MVSFDAPPKLLKLSEQKPEGAAVYTTTYHPEALLKATQDDYIILKARQEGIDSTVYTELVFTTIQTRRGYPIDFVPPSVSVPAHQHTP